MAEASLEGAPNIAVDSKMVAQAVASQIPVAVVVTAIAVVAELIEAVEHTSAHVVMKAVPYVDLLVAHCPPASLVVEGLAMMNQLASAWMGVEWADQFELANLELKPPLSSRFQLRL